MEHAIDMKWAGKMAFKTNLDGHEIILDADESVGGEDNGPRPKQLMLVSLAGCTGMDVVSILKKMRVDFKDLAIKVTAALTNEHPKQYTKMHVVYTFTGNNLPMDKLQKAVSLSEERYCGVRAAYEKAMQVTSEIKINKG